MNNMITFSILSITIATLAAPLNVAFAQSDELEFAAALEEALGHFRALELNLDEGNTQLAITHATHPIAELYDSIAPQLKAADPVLDARINTALSELSITASTDVPRGSAQDAVDAARDLVEEARTKVVGDELSGETNFKLLLMRSLLETSIAEYGEAVSGGVIGELAEFQDGSAFVWRAQVIFGEIRGDIPAEDAGNIADGFSDVNEGYDTLAHPSEIALTTGEIISRIDRLAGFDGEKIEFAAALEEALGHFRALELNLDEGNTQLAITHATHPIAELYDSIAPQLKTAGLNLDARINTALSELSITASTDVPRGSAQDAVDAAKDLVEEARTKVVGDELSGETNFRLILMRTLLETSIAEYGEAVSGGVIEEPAEFQDGSAFVWRAQVIFGEIRGDIPAEDADYMAGQFTRVDEGYDALAHPAEVSLLVGDIISRIDGITGYSGEKGTIDYIDEIRALLDSAGTEYRQGNTDVALSHATKAYLDNFEFLEGPLIEAGEREFMLEVEVLMRVELRSMIGSGAPASGVDAQIALILEALDTVEVILVPDAMMEENVICSTEGLADYELCVSYDITGGMVTGAAVNQMDTSIVFGIDATDDGTVTFYMTPSDISGANLVLVDGEEWDDVEIDGSTVTVSFPAGAEEIEVFGASVIPEFGTMAMIILVIAITGIIAVTARSRVIPRL